MDGVDPLALARARFAFAVAFQIVLPAFSIGLASYLAVLKALHLRTGRAVYLALFDVMDTDGRVRTRAVRLALDRRGGDAHPDRAREPLVAVP